jgi:hypothetical protein
MTVQYVAPLQRGWERMRRLLLEPFNFVTWLTLAFTAWLANLGSGSGPGMIWNGSGSDGSRKAMDSIHDAWSSLVAHVFLVPLIVFAVLVALALLLVVVWLSSRGKLMFLDNVVHGRALIAEPWRRWQRLGNSLFLWRIGFGAVCLLVVASVLALVLGPAVMAGSWRDPLAGLSIAAAIVGGLVLAVLALLALAVSLLLDSFVVPLMYRYDLTTTAAWSALVPWLKAYPGHFILYALFVLVLALFMGLCGFLVCLLTCFACCIWLIPLVGGYVMTAVLLPLWVAYRAFTVDWLAQLDPKFDLFALARPTATLPGTPSS